VRYDDGWHVDRHGTHEGLGLWVWDLIGSTVADVVVVESVRVTPHTLNQSGIEVLGAVKMVGIALSPRVEVVPQNPAVMQGARHWADPPVGMSRHERDAFAHGVYWLFSRGETYAGSKSK